MRPESFSMNPYEVLGVSPNASNEEIQAAYRQHALRWHPDRNPGDDYALRMMQRVNAAWTILKDEQSRTAYDRWERGETRSASGPQAWRRPHADSSPGGEWYRPPPPASAACPRCQRFNEAASIYCYSCGFPLNEEKRESSSSTSDYRPQHDANAQPNSTRPGGFWIRLVAYLVDVTIVFVLTIVLASALGFSLSEWWSELSTSEELPCGAFDWMFVITYMLYFTVFAAAWSTSLGKMMFGIKLVRNDGSKIGFCRAFFRCVLHAAFISGINALVVAIRRDKRGLHDLICDTKVVYR